MRDQEEGVGGSCNGRGRCGHESLRAEPFLAMARSTCDLGNGELKWLRAVFGVESFYSPSGGRLGLGWRGRLNRCLNAPYDMTRRHSWKGKRWSVVTFPHGPWQKPSSSPALTHMTCAQPPSPIASLASPLLHSSTSRTLFSVPCL